MRHNHIIKCCVTKHEMEKIKADAMVNGFGSVSAYLRFLSLNKMFNIETKWQSIYNQLIEK